MILYYIRDM